MVHPWFTPDLYSEQTSGTISDDLTSHDKGIEQPALWGHVDRVFKELPGDLNLTGKVVIEQAEPFISGGHLQGDIFAGYFIDTKEKVIVIHYTHNGNDDWEKVRRLK